MLIRALVTASLLLVCPSTRADTHITIKTHVDALYQGGVVREAEDFVTEIWATPTKMARLTANSALLIDSERKTLVVVNKREKSFVIAPLPIDWEKLTPPPLAARIVPYPLKGELRAVQEKKPRQVNQWRAVPYELDTWYELEETRVNMRHAVIWVAADVGFDWKVLRALEKLSWNYENYDAALSATLDSIPGYTVRTDTTVFTRGATHAESHEVVAVANEPAPGGVYEIPAGLTQKDQLSLADILNH